MLPVLWGKMGGFLSVYVYSQVCVDVCLSIIACIRRKRIDRPGRMCEGKEKKPRQRGWFKRYEAHASPVSLHYNIAAGMAKIKKPHTGNGNGDKTVDSAGPDDALDGKYAWERTFS